MARLTDIEGVYKSSGYVVNNPSLVQVLKGFNARKKFYITDLVKDIDAAGLLNPLWVRRDRANEEQPFILIDGERRLRALHKLFEQDPKREEHIPVIVFDVDEEEAEDLMAKANLEREAFTLSERIGLVQRYLKRGIEVEDVADRLNRSPAWVTQLITLKGASAKVKKAADEDRITVAAALMIARKTKAADQEEALAQVLKGAGGVKKATTRAAAKVTRTALRPGKKELMKVLAALETKDVGAEGVGAEDARKLVLMALSFAAGEADREALLDACAKALQLAKADESQEPEEMQATAPKEEDAGKKSPGSTALDSLLEQEDESD